MMANFGPRQTETETEIYRLDKDGYFWRGRSQRFYPGSHGMLHRILWMEAHGPIPKGYDLHHRDGDRENNVLENYEIMPASRHVSMHRQAAPFRDFACLECGQVARSQAHNALFCSNACGQRNRWHRRPR